MSINLRLNVLICQVAHLASSATQHLLSEWTCLFSDTCHVLQSKSPLRISGNGNSLSHVSPCVHYCSHSPILSEASSCDLCVSKPDYVIFLPELDNSSLLATKNKICNPAYRASPIPPHRQHIYCVDFLLLPKQMLISSVTYNSQNVFYVFSYTSLSQKPNTDLSH